jgi:hypothetical protein
VHPMSRDNKQGLGGYDVAIIHSNIFLRPAFEEYCLWCQRVRSQIAVNQPSMFVLNGYLPAPIGFSL